MERTNIRIARFADGDFWVDIVEASDFDGVETWLTHKDYTISMRMLRLPYMQNGKRTPDKIILAMIDDSLFDYEQDYLELYKEYKDEQKGETK